MISTPNQYFTGGDKLGPNVKTLSDNDLLKWYRDLDTTYQLGNLSQREKNIIKSSRK